MEKENKKTLINTKIGKEDIEKYSKIILKKALKVIACNGSIYALKLLENKDIETLKDLQQEVATQIILDGYVVTKNAYHIVRKYMYYNYEKTPLEIFTNNGVEEKENIIDKTIEKNCYLSYMNNNNSTELKKAKKIDLKKLYNLLSETEKKIFQYYIINNVNQIQVAKILDIKRNAVNVYKSRILKKAEKCLMEV